MTYQLDTPIQELDVVVLTHNLPEHGLKQGDRGAIVHVYPNSQTFEVEFVNPDGSTQALLTIAAHHLQKIESFQPSPHPEIKPVSNQSKIQMNFHGSVHGAAGNVEGDMIVNPTQAESKASIDMLVPIIRALEQKYTFVQDEQQALKIIDAEFTEIKAKQLPQWQDLMNIKRLYSGGKKAALKVGEHFAEQNPWGKGFVAFLEGVSEDVK